MTTNFLSEEKITTQLNYQLNVKFDKNAKKKTSLVAFVEKKLGRKVSRKVHSTL